MPANQQSAANHAEFASVIITIDHLSGPRADGHVANKMVFSTEGLTAAMLALFDYYGEQHLLASAPTIELFQRAAQVPCAAFVYRTPQNTQVVLEWNCFAFLSNVAGSTLGAVQMALDNAGLAQIESDERTGDVVPLLLMAFGSEAVSDPAAKQQEAVPVVKKPKTRVTGQRKPTSRTK